MLILLLKCYKHHDIIGIDLVERSSLIMNLSSQYIHGIPSVIWGKKTDKVILAIHGNQSNKSDTPIKVLANLAEKKGYQVLSFDLPEHGDRKNEPLPCKVQYCVADLHKMMSYAKEKWSTISLFANSLGAYFSLLAFPNEPLEKALFLSPVVDMERTISNMMSWFNITEKQLESEQNISTPIGQMLYWDYYCYVKEHPIKSWNIPTYILYGEKDDVCEYDTIETFKNQFGCNLQILKNCEHYFHTSEQVSLYESWLKQIL